MFEECVQIDERGQQEDEIYDRSLRERLSGCGKKAQRIWQYVCVEMLNNALEHSSNVRMEAEGIVLENNC